MSPGAVKFLRRVIVALPGPVRRSGKLGLRHVRAVVHPHLPPVFLNSIPKAGTHLLARLLDAMGYRLFANQPFNPDVLVDYDPEGLPAALRGMLRAEYVIEHLPWNPAAEAWLESAGVKTLFIHRDPRATAVSFAHYVSRMHPHHRLHAYFASLGSVEAGVRAVLEGVPGRLSSNGRGRPSQADLYDAFHPWLKASAVCSVSFTELIGPKGGGSEAMQASAVRRVTDHLGLELNASQAASLAARVFNPGSVTFREARIEGWRREVSPELLELLNERLSRQIIEWGCEL